MADRSRLVVALLAAGSSQRFGEHDKLSAPFRGDMLGLHAARAIPREFFEDAWVISRAQDHPCAAGWQDAGFVIHENPDAGSGMGTSVALAARLAIAAKADGLMIALADMPLVPEKHFADLVEAARKRGPSFIASSSDGSMRSPPAILGSDHLPTLANSSGDKGARALLGSEEVITCPAEWLTDIDTPEALAALQ